MAGAAWEGGETRLGKTFRQAIDPSAAGAIAAEAMKHILSREHPKQMEARIVHVADRYDALRSKRPYKDAWPHARAHETLLRGDGRTLRCHFDPQMLATYERIADCWRDIFDATTASADAPQSQIQIAG